MHLIPLGAPALLGLFREVLDSSLVERGVAEGMELLGHADAFWPAVALPELMRMAQGGNPHAQAELAWRSAVGEGLAKSVHEAAQWTTKSAEKHCPAGEAVLGWLLYQGFGLPRDYAEAARLFERAAEHKDSRGMAWFALCLLRGHGVSANATRGGELLRAAAKSGSPLAQYWLGRLLYGIGGQADVARDEAALPQATESGWQPALDELERYWFAGGERHFHGHGVVVDAARARQCYRKAGELGHHLVPTCREAFRWLEQAVEQHEDAYALYSLGYMLLHGQGVRRDAKAGLKHLRRAAVMGELNAQYELGSAYYRGVGATKNLKLAMKWLRMAAEHGQEEARAFLERIERGSKLN